MPTPPHTQRAGMSPTSKAKIAPKPMPTTRPETSYKEGKEDTTWVFPALPVDVAKDVLRRDDDGGSLFNTRVLKKKDTDEYVKSVLSGPALNVKTNDQKWGWRQRIFVHFMIKCSST